MIKHTTQAIRVGVNTLATDLIEQIGPGGNFLAEEHTLRNFRKMWFPTLMDRTRFARWKDGDKLSFSERLSKKTREIMTTHKPEPLQPEIREKISSLEKEWATRKR